jgi:hypothetical protein
MKSVIQRSTARNSSIFIKMAWPRARTLRQINSKVEVKSLGFSAQAPAAFGKVHRHAPRASSRVRGFMLLRRLGSFS